MKWYDPLLAFWSPIQTFEDEGSNIVYYLVSLFMFTLPFFSLSFFVGLPSQYFTSSVFSLLFLFGSNVLSVIACIFTLYSLNSIVKNQDVGRFKSVALKYVGSINYMVLIAGCFLLSLVQLENYFFLNGMNLLLPFWLILPITLIVVLGGGITFSVGVVRYGLDLKEKSRFLYTVLFLILNPIYLLLTWFVFYNILALFF